MKDLKESIKRRCGKFKSATVCRAEFDYEGWKYWGNWRRAILLDPTVATTNEPSSSCNTSEARASAGSASVDNQTSAACSLREEIVQDFQADTERHISLTSMRPSPVRQKPASQTAEEQRRKLFLQRNHNCWIHCDFPSECRHTLYQAIFAGEVPESELYCWNGCTGIGATVTDKWKGEAISGAGRDPNEETTGEQVQAQVSSFEVDEEGSDSSDESDVDNKTSAADPVREEGVPPDQESPFEENSPRPVNPDQFVATPVHTFDKLNTDNIYDTGPPHRHILRSFCGLSRRSLEPEILQLFSGSNTSPGGSLNPIKLSGSPAEGEPSWSSSALQDRRIDDALKHSEKATAEGGEISSAPQLNTSLHDFRATHASCSSSSECDGQNQEDDDRQMKFAEWARKISRDDRSKIKISKIMGLDSLQRLTSGTRKKKKPEPDCDGARVSSVFSFSFSSFLFFWCSFFFLLFLPFCSCAVDVVKPQS